MFAQKVPGKLATKPRRREPSPPSPLRWERLPSVLVWFCILPPQGARQKKKRLSPGERKSRPWLTGPTWVGGHAGERKTQDKVEFTVHPSGWCSFWMQPFSGTERRDDHRGGWQSVHRRQR